MYQLDVRLETWSAFKVQEWASSILASVPGSTRDSCCLVCLSMPLLHVRWGCNFLTSQRCCVCERLKPYHSAINCVARAKEMHPIGIREP